jgi:two-component system NtrC family response regulator
MISSSSREVSGTAPQSADGAALSRRGEPLPTDALRVQLELIAPRAATVLLEGETGVGKEVAARAIHAGSPRAGGPFVPVDCTAFSTELMESQLFGHVKGAFTGAISTSLGFVRCAHGGTLFLDEIGELPLPVQAKLLRCLQERTVVPVGGANPIAVDVRIVAATHRDLPRMVREGAFRQDLFFRLNVVRIAIPPLRERRGEIVPLARQFVADVAAAYEEAEKFLAPDAETALLQHDWPGNVRELRNAVERAFLYCRDRTIAVTHLPEEVRGGAIDAADSAAPAACDALGPIPLWADAERALIVRALEATGGNQADAARLLAVERHRLRRKIVLYDLERLIRSKPR